MIHSIYHYTGGPDMTKKMMFPFDVEEELSKAKTMDDLTGHNGIFTKLLKNMTERILAEEMKAHLGYEKSDQGDKDTANRRNGSNKKKVRTQFGDMELETPRDREGSFTPQLVPKRSRDISRIDHQIISMYAKGMTTRDIQSHLYEIYGTDVSPAYISIATEKIMQMVTEWQNRVLDDIYPIVFLDAIHYKVRQDGKVITKASYTCLGITKEGKKEILGIWVGESEGASYWLRILNELKNRGVKDIFIACVDGLQGFPEAIASVFPKTQIQLCIIHMIRNSMKYVVSKRRKEFCADLKPIYKAPTEEIAKEVLEEVENKWGKQYPLAVKPWRKHWEYISTFFQYPEEIRKTIYTTNAVEAVHRQLRKVTKNRASFPNDESLVKILFLAIRDVSKKWTKAIPNWPLTISQFSIIFKERLDMR
jgi:putative transposase